MAHIPELKAIPTKYKGYTFRSRLEARWAVFLDTLKIEWQYEQEGYDLDGIWYLPDFWLPKFMGDGSFLEVKPYEVISIELEKSARLCLASNKMVILAEGVPDTKCQRFLYPETCRGVTDYDIGIGLMGILKKENSMYVFPEYRNSDLTISKENWDLLGITYIIAVENAKGVVF